MPRVATPLINERLPFRLVAFYATLCMLDDLLNIPPNNSFIFSLKEKKKILLKSDLKEKVGSHARIEDLVPMFWQWVLEDHLKASSIVLFVHLLHLVPLFLASGRTFVINVPFVWARKPSL